MDTNGIVTNDVSFLTAAVDIAANLYLGLSHTTAYQ